MKKGKVGKYSYYHKMISNKKIKKTLKSSISDNFCKDKKSDFKKVNMWLLEYSIEGIFGDLILVLIMILIINIKWYIASTSCIDMKYC